MLARFLTTAFFLLIFPTSMVWADSPGLIETGKRLFEDNCVECHGEDAASGSSGDIRDADLQQVRMATGGVEDMPEFELTEEEIKSLVAYLNDLLAKD